MAGEGVWWGAGGVHEVGRGEVGQEGRVHGGPGRRGCGAGVGCASAGSGPVGAVFVFYCRCKECALDRQFI